MMEGVIAGRSLRVFHRESLWRPLEDKDPPDGYYDFTKEDYYRVARGYEKPEPVFKTKAVREQEEQEAAEKLGPVRVRYIFPEGLICETQFSATELVDAVFHFLSALILPEMHEHTRLFTTPPKRILIDRDQTLFRAKLVPHVHLFVECTASSHVSILKPEIHDLRHDLEPIGVTMPEEKQPPSPKVLPEKRPVRSVPSEGDGNRVPKWFKFGRRT